MRVLAIGSVYPPHLLGGYEVVWQGVSRELLAQGHATRMLVSDFRSPEVPAGAPEDPDVHRTLRWYWRDHAWPRMSLAATLALERHNAAVLADHLADFAPDIVAFWPMGGMSLSLIAQVRRAGLPAVFFAHDPWTVYGPQRDRWTRIWARARPLAAPAAAVTGLPTRLDLDHGRWLFNSAWMREHSGVRVAPERAGVLSPGIEPRFLPATPFPPQAWRGRLLYLGRVVEQKGILSAIEALAQLPAATRLMIIGDGDAGYRTQLLARIRELRLSERVELRPGVDRDGALAAYAAADVVLHPVLWGEPWGLVPLEAMGVGRPVIATGRGGSAEYLVDGTNALLHPAGDAEALAVLVRALAADSALRARLIDAGRDTALVHNDVAFRRAAVAELEAELTRSRS